jgi:hypothetical protein
MVGRNGRTSTTAKAAIMKKRTAALAVVAALGLLTALVAPAGAATTSAPTSTGGIVPYILDEPGPGGNVTCEALGYEYTTARVNYNGDFDASFVFDNPAASTVSVTVTNGTYVAFVSTVPLGAVIVKGGNDANIYEYDGTVTADSGLASPPVGAQQNPAGLSNLTFCTDDPGEEDEGEWCSPGYWRQAHHLESWAATGISPDELYSAHFGAVTLGKKAQKDGAPLNPTLWEVLQSPQWYGGGAFNNVGDLLSGAHPDVNFLGERVEDSCPLS